MYTADEISKLLGRTLTEQESSNFKLYLNIAIQQVEDMLCFKLCCDEDTKTYDAREGYQTVFTAPFQDITSVKLNGTTVSSDDYKVKQNDSYSGSWFNSIVFNKRLGDDLVEVEADWGFGSKLPNDLASFLAGMFDQHSLSQRLDGNVKSKEVEDFRITYKDTPSSQDFYSDNLNLINKYSLCNVTQIAHGADNAYGVRRFHY